MPSKRRRGDEASLSAEKKQRIDDSEEDSSEENDDTVIESSLREPSLSTKEGKLLGGHSASDPVAGVVKRISVNNFMCHNRLEVVLGSHVNFVVGRNGSGKSAIVTALVVGLGGKASITSRGTSIKGFVKVGKRSGWVEIVLNNKGKDSYKYHIYGDKITIIRKFSAEGSSSYAIKNEKGQHISNRRDELARITDHLNIQVDNPVSILNQDTSRNFLNSKSAGDKFKFFMKATQLEQMTSDYEHVDRSKVGANMIIADKEKTMPKMKNEVRQWETKFKNMMAVSELKKKVKKLKNEMAWALVNQKERGLKPMTKALDVEVEALPRFQRKVEESKDQLEAWEARHKEVQERLVDYGNEVRSLQPMLDEKKKEYQKAKEKLQPISMELKACDRELSITKRDCRQCQERIDELKTTASHDYEAERKQREETINKLQHNLNELLSQQKVREHELEQFRGAIAKNKSDLATVEKQLNERDKKLREFQNTLTDLRRAKNDRLQRFGQWMPDVVEKIKQNEKKFTKLPVGPIGACFDLVEPKWAMAVETCLKGLVSSFVCHSHQDERLLLNIFSACPRGRRPTIIISAFNDNVHNVQNTRCQSDRYPCLVDVLKFDNPVVMNTLIDQRTVERIVLIEDDQEARKVMKENPPRNVRECFTIEGDQIYCQPTFRYYANDKPGVRYLMADAAEQIASYEREQKRVTAEKSNLIKQREILTRELHKNQSEEKKLMTQFNKLKEAATRVNFDIREVENVEDPQPVDVTTLEEEVSSCKQKIAELQERRVQCMKQKTETEEMLRIAKESCEQVEATIREKTDTGMPLRDEITQAQAEVEKAKNERKHYTAKLKEQERKIEELQSDIDKYKEELEVDRKKATEFCPPIATKRSDTSIENEIKQTQKRIDEEEEVHGNEKEIIEKYQEKKKVYDTVQAEVRQLKNYLKKLDEVMMRRQQAYLKMRKDIASRTKYYFIIQLYQRHFKGRMNFDFNKNTLDILVNPNSDAVKSGNATISDAKDLKSLSGGERSFSTVCFILALWEAMEAPFRCLDEFDVFMDMVNRRVSMDMMLETADMHKDMQFVFLTPQDMRSVRKIDNVKIFRMPDPERTQKMLNFSQDDRQ